MQEIVKEIALKIQEAGGKAYFVGGIVRDKQLNIENKDVDIEVFNIEENKLKEILNEFGEVEYFGSAFGIYHLKKHDIDFALPRSEIKTGIGHRDFKIIVDPYVSVKEAAKRRDFTINSMYEDVLSGELIDEYGGLKDLQNKVLRHVDDETFKDDPLRVLRGAQFAARFDLSVDLKTKEIFKTIDLSSLSKERVFEELKKSLIKANKPSIFFEVLKENKQLHTWFKEIEDLIGLSQDPIFHPEGDVYIHTMNVLDEASKYKDKCSDELMFMLLALCHDLGKKVTWLKDGERIHNFNHENKLELSESFIRRLTNNNGIYDYLMKMIPMHMELNACYWKGLDNYHYYQVFDNCYKPEDLIYFSLADHKESDERYLSFKERFNEYSKIKSNNYLKGEDLLKMGYSPDSEFNEILKEAHDLALRGLSKEEIVDKLKK